MRRPAASQTTCPAPLLLVAPLRAAAAPRVIHKRIWETHSAKMTRIHFTHTNTKHRFSLGQSAKRMWNASRLTPCSLSLKYGKTTFSRNTRGNVRNYTGAPARRCSRAPRCDATSPSVGPWSSTRSARWKINSEDAPTLSRPVTSARRRAQYSVRVG